MAPRKKPDILLTGEVRTKWQHMIPPNPIFIEIGRRRMRPSKRSAEWCLEAVDQCWSQKALQLSGDEIAAAKKAFEHARQTYKTPVRDAD